MKYLVFSDTHLGKDFDKKKFLFLKKTIDQSDRVIINGDFWEGLQITFDEFVHSPWSELFPYLKKKHAVYVYGNHDLQKWTDERVSLFSSAQANQYTFKSDDKIFIVEHGDRAFILGVIIAKTISNIILLFTGKNPQISYHLEKFVYTVFGKDFHQRLSKAMNNNIKKQLGKEISGGKILICGHSHHQDYDVRHNFVNTGTIQFGMGQYAIIENGKVILKEEMYK